MAGTAARIGAELRRVLTQWPALALAGAAVAVAAWAARWSPELSRLDGGPPSQLVISVGTAVNLAAVQMATGLGVAVAAVFAAAGPGRDFADGSAELRRANGSAAGRYLSRVLAIASLVVAAGLCGVVALTAASVLTGLRNGYELRIAAGDVDVALLGKSAALLVFNVAWIVTVAQRARTQALQLAIPIAALVVMFLFSRLLPVPLTPDAWLGPILDLRAERALLDFWWSVGGKILWPWGNVALLGATLALAAALGLSSDRRARAGS